MMAQQSELPLITLIAGDGIGPEVIQAARQVLTAVGFRARYQELEAGYGCFERCGKPLPPETLEAARRADAVLFGAVTTPAELPDYPSVILTLRRELGLYANLRPFRTVPGLGRYGDENLDILVVRENTEGLYLQAGWREADRAYNLLRRCRGEGEQRCLEEEDGGSYHNCIPSPPDDRRLGDVAGAHDHSADLP